jgi:hypothetical protein
LATTVRAVALVGHLGFFCVRKGCDEAEAPEDSAGLIGCEVGPVEARQSGQDLLWRETASCDNHIVLVNRLGEDACDGLFDDLRPQVERLVGDAECRHLRIVVSDTSLRNRLWKP